MHRASAVKKRRKSGRLDQDETSRDISRDSITSASSSRSRDSILLQPYPPHTRPFVRKTSTFEPLGSIERICEEADDTESIISSECTEVDPGVDGVTANLQVQDIWPSREVARELHLLPGSQEVLALLEKSDVDGILAHPHGPTLAVLWLSWLGNHRLLDLVLKAGAPVNACDVEGRTPLHLSSITASSECVSLLLQHNANPDVWDKGHLATPLHCAAAAGSLECINLLLQAGAPIDAGISSTGSGKPPLLYAVQSNAIQCVLKLVESGAAVNMSQVFTETPLHVAAGLGFAECVQVLLDAGADNRVQFGPFKSTPLHLAAEDGNAACAKLLIEAGADINKTSSKEQTPLHLAALAQSAKTLELLLQQKVDANARDADHRTPLHCAIVKGSRSCECVQLLLQYGANVNAADAFGYTPVHIAALNDFSSCLRLLLDHGGDVTKRTNGNVSALSFIARRTPEIMKHLETKLDQAIRLHDHELGDIDCEIQLNFRILVPDIRAGETKLLLTIIEVGQRRLLRHALVRTFLHLKWLQIRKYFVLSLIIHALYVLLCSVYILHVFLDESSLDSLVPTLGNGFEVLNVILLLSTIAISCKEFFQFAHNRKIYIGQWENWLQWLIIVTVFITLVPPSWIPSLIVIQHHISVYGIFFNWIELMVLMGRFPMFGLYVQMFTTGAVNFSKFLLAYCCLLVAFAFTFRMTFPRYKAFQDITASVVKTVVMMTGELEFEDIFFPETHSRMKSVFLANTNVPYPGTAHMFFLFFTLIVTTVLTNLLVGLSVSDIQGLQSSAGLDRLVRQSQLVAYMESMLFSSLWNWVPPRILMFIRRSATLLASPSRRSLIIRPNDPREGRIPRELVAAAYKCVVEKKQARAKWKSSKRERRNSRMDDVDHCGCRCKY